MKLLWNFLLSETVESFLFMKCALFRKFFHELWAAEACDYFNAQYTLFFNHSVGA